MNTPNDLQLPEEFQEALDTDTLARERFDALSPSHKREYILWIAEGKTPETRHRRAQEAVDRLNTKAH